MSSQPTDEPVVRPIDRFLAFTSLGLIVLSIGCFLATIIATAAGNEDFDAGLWPTVFLLQMVGPVIAFVLLITLLVMNVVRKGRAARG
jgi:hypothetical protein